MKAILIGDTHLDLLPKFGISEEDALAKLSLALRKHKVKNVFLLGDAFNTPHPPQKSVSALINFFLQHDDRHFYVIVGNHDYGGNFTSLDLIKRIKLPNVKVFTKPKLLQVDDAKVHFVPFPYKAGIAGVVNVGHFEIEGFKRDNSTRTDSLIKADGNLWVLGHLHNQQGKGTIHYIGSAWQVGFGNAEVRKYIGLLHFTNAKDFKVTYEEIDRPFTLENVRVKSQRDLENLKADVLYKLKLENGIVLPPNFQDAHPNVLKVDAASSLAKQALKEGQEISLEVEGMSISEVLKESVNAYLIDAKVPKHLRKEVLQEVLSLLPQSA